MTPVFCSKFMFQTEHKAHASWRYSYAWWRPCQEYWTDRWVMFISLKTLFRLGLAGMLLCSPQRNVSSLLLLAPCDHLLLGSKHTTAPQLHPPGPLHLQILIIYTSFHIETEWLSDPGIMFTSQIKTHGHLAGPHTLSLSKDLKWKFQLLSIGKMQSHSISVIYNEYTQINACYLVGRTICIYLP